MLRPRTCPIFSVLVVSLALMLGCIEETPSAAIATDITIIALDSLPYRYSAADAQRTPLDVTPPSDITDIDKDLDFMETEESQSSCECDSETVCIDEQCIPIICSPGQSECAAVTSRKVCNASGTAWLSQLCSAQTVCIAGDCTLPICETVGGAFCNSGQVATCVDGGQVQLKPCPGGSGCLDGQCVPVTPNVVLVVDTSGSMSYLWDEPDVWPEDCTQNCPPWIYPDCDNPNSPKTRLGRTKVALNAMLNDQLINLVRLALMRFPQRISSPPNCRSGHHTGLGVMTMDDGAHQVGEWFSKFLWQIMMVPFQPDTTANDLTSMTQWFDFEETLSVNGAPCVSDLDCPQLLCIQGQCAKHSAPELRGTGPTPLGKSLFYAAEYLRREVLVEGRPCATDLDCKSPNHTCVDAACHDPFSHCRATEIILFTDGQETVFLNQSDYFHPVTQAKRLHYGLGCTADIQCSNGAVCNDTGHCTPPPGTIPTSVCDSINTSCNNDSDCPAYDCGEELPCPGQCMNTKIWVKDPEQQNYLKGADGTPLPLTVHVVDASAGTQSHNSLIAAYGGGEHLSVSLADISALSEALLSLLDPKTGPSCAINTSP